jgi:hypothetical protein
MDWRRFVKRYIYKDDLKVVLEKAELTISGTVDELIDRLIEEADWDYMDFLGFFDKGELKEICDEHDLPVSGSRDDLEERILEEVIEVSEDELKWMGFVRDDESTTEKPALDVEEVEVRPPAVVGQEIDVSKPLGNGSFDGLVEVIRQWMPNQRYKYEDGYAVDLRSFLQNRGYECRGEAGVSSADIEVDGKFPIEVKKNPTLTQYDRMIGQLVRHCRSKGCAVAVVCDVKRGDLHADFEHNVKHGLVHADRIRIVAKPY